MLVGALLQNLLTDQLVFQQISAGKLSRFETTAAVEQRDCLGDMLRFEGSKDTESFAFP